MISISNPALTHMEDYARINAGEEERSLIMEDIDVWCRHWECFLRTQPGGQHRLAIFLSQVAMGTTQQPRQEGIALLTVHSAKGLEFDVVAVVGMAEGIFPDYRAAGESMEEEKRKHLRGDHTITSPAGTLVSNAPSYAMGRCEGPVTITFPARHGAALQHEQAYCMIEANSICK